MKDINDIATAYPNGKNETITTTFRRQTMSEKTMRKCLPASLIEEIQKYIDGEYIYIPKKANERKKWGSNTGSRDELKKRNEQIYMDYLSGITSKELSEIYYLSLKSIQRIILSEKRKN